tara:strand:+ start:772 stop:1977 length:1206 start_codon:yes stop_codon:yes gene_type:complete
MALKYLYVPSGYKAGTAYGVLPNVAAADFAFVRGSAGTRVNADGLIQSEITNVPRLDYTDGTCPTLLTEPERINLAKTSENLASWGKNPSDGTVTIRANEEISPDGNMTADVVSVLTQFDGVYTLGITTTEESTYSCSAYVRHVSGSSKIRLGITSNFHSSTGTKYIVVDLSNGSITDNEVSSFATARVVNVGNGWYRAIIENSTVPLGGGGSSNFVIYSYEDSFTEFSVWGGQIEVGDYTSSYIPNLSSGTTTRSADTGVISGDLSSYINSSEGVLEIKAKALFNGGNDCRITLSDGTNNNRVGLIWFSSPNNTSVIVQKDATTVVNPNLNIDQTLMTTFKIKWKSGDIQVKVNGTVVFTDTSTFSELILDQLSFSKGTETNFFQGNVQYIKVYDSVTDF